MDRDGLVHMIAGALLLAKEGSSQASHNGMPDYSDMRRLAPVILDKSFEHADVRKILISASKKELERKKIEQGRGRYAG